MAKMMSPNTTIWWVPDSAGLNILVPSAALLTVARNISCAVVSGYTLNATDSDVDDSTSICDASNVALPTFYNYEANITFFRDSDLVTTTTDYAKAFNFFKMGKQYGWLVRRLGYASTVAAAATQVVSIYKVMSDIPQDVVADSGPIEFTVPFTQQGSMNLNVALAA